MSDKQKAWNDLIELTNDEDRDVREDAVSTLGSVFPHIPNPTNGSLTLELKSPALSEMILHVTSLTGQVVLEVQMEPGKFIHTIKTNYLPEGLYFLQMISDGQMVSVNKFVKH